ncbi:MAG: HAMP domain-containing sensor histidine kinase [Sediminicola sp.]
MKKRNLYILVFVVSVLGLFVVQYQYLKIGLNLAKVQFTRNIGLSAQTIRRDLSERNELSFLIGKSITRDSSYFNLRLDSVQDAASHFLDDLIRDRLAINGISTDFSYVLAATDSTEYLRAPGDFKDNVALNSYPIPLEGYLPELVDQKLVLELRFKDMNTYFLFQLNGLTIPSLIFMLAIILVVIWVLRSFYWQRKVIMTTNEFLNNLIHELKTPVFSIGLATKILEENTNREGQAPLIALIRQQVERLKIHIDKVLELGSLESGKRVFQLEVVDFAPYLQRLCHDFNTLSGLENVKFSWELQPGAYTIRAECAHLENAINNLLDNAKKYSKKPEIDLSAIVREGKLIIKVEDNGEGIAKKDKYRIFQKYYRVTQGDLHNVKGYGLGLSYVKNVVRLHKGKITIDSELGKGTAISIILPLILTNAKNV